MLCGPHARIQVEFHTAATSLSDSLSHVVQDFMLGNKLFIVSEYMPYSLLQLLEGGGQPPLAPPQALTAGTSFHGC